MKEYAVSFSNAIFLSRNYCRFRLIRLLSAQNSPTILYTNLIMSIFVKKWNLGRILFNFIDFFQNSKSQ